MDPGATDPEPERHTLAHFFLIFGHQKLGSWSGFTKKTCRDSYAHYQLGHTSPPLMRYILNSVGDPDPHPDPYQNVISDPQH
jgi:hypothetical protein